MTGENPVEASEADQFAAWMEAMWGYNSTEIDEEIGGVAETLSGEEFEYVYFIMRNIGLPNDPDEDFKEIDEDQKKKAWKIIREQKWRYKIVDAAWYWCEEHVPGFMVHETKRRLFHDAHQFFPEWAFYWQERIDTWKAEEKIELNRRDYEVETYARD